MMLKGIDDLIFCAVGADANGVDTDGVELVSVRNVDSG